MHLADLRVKKGKDVVSTDVHVKEEIKPADKEAKMIKG